MSCISGIFDLQKLQEICDPYAESAKEKFGHKYNPWGMDSFLDKTILQSYVDNGIETKLHERCKFVTSEVAKAYHYARIAYFVNHGWTDMISLKFGDIGRYDYWPGWTVINGNHRYCASLYLGDKKISGRIVNMPKSFDYKYFLA